MGRGDSALSELPEVERTGITIEPETARERRTRKKAARLGEVCPCAGHEFIGSREQPDAYDRVSVLVTITAPEGPAKANQPERACVSCAAKLCETYLGFGWFVSADPLA